MAAKPRFDGEWVKVSEVFNLQMGKTPSRKNPSYWNNGDHDWVSIKDLGSYGRYVGHTKETISELGRMESGIKPVPAGTLLMSFKLSLGKTAITTKQTYTNEAIMAFLDKGCYQFDLGYMWHQFRSKDWTEGTNIAVMGKTLNKQTLGKAMIRLPELREQENISTLLDKAQEQLAIAETMQVKLDTLVKSRFVEMFGDASSEAVIPLRECCSEIQGGKTPSMKHPEYYGGTVPFIKSGDVKGDAVSSGALWLSDVAIERAGVRIVERGSVLVVARSALLQRKVCSALCAVDVAVNQDIKAFTPKEEFSGSYLLWAIRSHERRLLAGVRSVSTSALDFDDLCSLPVKAASKVKQQEFADFIEQVDKSRFVIQQQIEKLQMLYDSLAQEYFS